MLLFDGGCGGVGGDLRVVDGYAVAAVPRLMCVDSCALVARRGQRVVARRRRGRAAFVAIYKSRLQSCLMIQFAEALAVAAFLDLGRSQARL